MATIAIAVFFLILLSAAFVCWRKRIDPEKEPPLHPSTLIMARRYRLEIGETFHNCASALAASDSARFSASTWDPEALVPERCTIGVRYREI